MRPNGFAMKLNMGSPQLLMPSKQQFEEAYALRSKMTVRSLRAMGRRVYPCNCGDVLCEGWQSVNPVLYWDDRLMRSAPGISRCWMQLLLAAWKLRLLTNELYRSR
jgi:hypothetical protein